MYLSKIKQYRTACQEYEKNGGHLSSIQRAYEGNLYQKPNLASFKPEEMAIVRALEDSQGIIKQYQNELDPYLLSNTVSILSRRGLEAI